MDENLYDEFGNYIGPDIPDAENVSIDNDEDQDENVIKEDQNQNIVNITVKKNRKIRMRNMISFFMKIRIIISQLMIFIQ